MHRPVRFADDIEPLVQFIEETDPGRILEATLAKLRDGLSVKKLLTASALAVTRSSDLPPGHHGGPLHPLVGLHALHHTVERVSGEQRFLPILQHVALSNKHINHPGMGPYILADAEPVDVGRRRGHEEGVLRRAWIAACTTRADHALPLALGQHPARRGAGPAADRGDPEEHARRSLLHLPHVHVARPRLAGTRAHAVPDASRRPLRQPVPHAARAAGHRAAARRVRAPEASARVPHEPG